MHKRYETVIGIEVHAQLCTPTKAFCSCSTQLGAAPNTQTCSICLGEPGATPVLNRQAVEYALRAALALHCRVPEQVGFDRKHYSAPDLPKGYQITQFHTPMGTHGHLDILMEGRPHSIEIARLHLEEDAGKSIYTEAGRRVDFNRAGIPLLEIVTTPSLHSAAEACAYLEALQLLLQYIGVSDGRIEEGSMRCEVNISLRPVGSEQLGELCEIKNIGSFRGVAAAIAYEEQRQAALLEQGLTVRRETRRWDETRQETIAMRSKEYAADYRYLPEPDLPCLIIDRDWLAALQQSLPELPLQRQQRYCRLGLSDYAAAEIVSDLALAAYFEDVLTSYPQAQEIANWLLGDVRARLNDAGLSFAACPLPPAALAELLVMLERGEISGAIGKRLLAEAFATGKSPAALAEAQQLRQISDTEQLQIWIAQVIADNAEAVADYRQGKDRALGYLVGQVMQLSRGRANPRLVNEMLREALHQ